VISINGREPFFCPKSDIFPSPRKTDLELGQHIREKIETYGQEDEK
jgi:hypothetical protein